MNRRYIIPIVLGAVSILLAVLGFFVLPEQVVIQFSIGSSGNATVPKFPAILIPAIIGVGGAVASVFPKDDEKAVKQRLVLSVVGICLAIFMMVVNALL